ncbi:M48 family metalloprotease [Dokdonella sp.]|uniref:M48 family metalloprotease n=1 Tax=Dokdonella sp. TaxID=2291710 RepID=UPI0037840DD5
MRASTDPSSDASLGRATLPAFTPAERESFFDGIARHRRSASRLAAVALACASVLALVVAALMAPLLYALIGLLLDLVNHLTPMPDLIRSITDSMSALIDHMDVVSLSRWLGVLVVAALPGLVLMTLAWRALGRAMREAMGGEALAASTRPVDATALAEQRFANVVAEMAIAAALPPPNVRVATSDAVNAVAFGADRGHASIVVTSGLLASLERAQLQGIAAHLVGSIANGDMRIGARYASVLGMFGLIARLSTSFTDREAARRFAALLRHALRPGGGAGDGVLAMQLTNPFEPEKGASHGASGESDIPAWRTWLWMPLAGPLVISGFFGGLLCMVLLGPLLALSWRRRKYLADAIAVQLTRDPAALGAALGQLRGAPVAGAFGDWIAHLCVVPPGSSGAASILGGSAVPMAPSLDRRLVALGIMGAHVTPHTAKAMPAWAWAILLPLGAIVAGLLGMVVFGLLYVSIALSMLFTWLPAVLLHALLR